MKRTAYLLINGDGEPRYVYEDKATAERLTEMMPYSVAEVAYDVPNPDTWESLEVSAAHLDYSNRKGFETNLRATDLVARCKKLAGADE